MSVRSGTPWISFWDLLFRTAKHNTGLPFSAFIAFMALLNVSPVPTTSSTRTTFFPFTTA